SGWSSHSRRRTTTPWRSRLYASWSLCPIRDLLLCAKHLFVAARTAWARQEAAALRSTAVVARRQRVLSASSRADHRELEGAAQYREHLQQGLLGLGRRQQQPLAGSTADLSLQGHREVVRGMLR